jgi:hypothetical protein
MTRTSSGAISNSASKPFSNCQGRITMDNHNRVIGSANVYDILEEINGNKPLPTNRYPNLQPLTPQQIALSYYSNKTKFLE